jgi:hypothetical protein
MGVYEMTDQCNGCVLKGDIKECLTAECGHHENWYARAQAARIAELEAVLRYYRDECPGYEPSVSVFQRMLDEVLE